MDASGEPNRGYPLPLPLPALQPGNGDLTERFPEFCLHTQDSRASTPTSSRYSTISTTSTVSTAFSSADSVCFTLRDDPDGPPTFAARPRTFSELSSPSSSAGTPRSRRDKKDLQAARQQRTGSTSRSIVGFNKAAASPGRRFQRTSSTPADALAALEPPHDQGLTRMAFAEQQRWITVQQKTFTKW